ncbi:hypothetical protein [Engelhardtia mirabilis]|uniref:Ferritin-like domain-containing protein n=1 Tax=Engelhardtia mirabilis TaxID=2528011 RepID=A0A518BJ07_9BACT|nr:hypothetical protein Pla133_20470 [Planctomycetes bacterium Pla133]QDV01299.1 hypothetical protein Pla86_20480 [Planctomycetes bacterium Pla86]
MSAADGETERREAEQSARVPEPSSADLDPGERVPWSLPPDVNVDLLGPLVRDMGFALRSEFGAYSIYMLLPLVARNAELRRLLVALRDEQREQVAGLRALISDLGGNPPASRWTRAVAAWGLFAITPVVGSRFALRLCLEAERTVMRWYAEYAIHLAERGLIEPAIRCREFCMVKRIHASRLGTFVDRVRS